MTWSFARAAIAAFALVLVSLSPLPARAENYPTKPITIVVPLGAGTGMDIVVRLYADKLAQVLGKAVVVENKPGAATMLAATQVANAQPDGHTLVVLTSSALAINQHLYKQINSENSGRPGGNLTGFSTFEPSVGGKWLALLKEAAPEVSRISLLFNPETAPFAEGYLNSAQAAAQMLGATVISAPCGNDADIQGAFAARAREGDGGIIGIADTFVADHRDLIIALATQHRLPAIYGNPIFALSGGLMVYSPDYADIYRRAAGYVDRILKGEKAADLPVQAPTKYKTVVNLKTAKALGLQIPASVLGRADEVIE